MYFLILALFIPIYIKIDEKFNVHIMGILIPKKKSGNKKFSIKPQMIDIGKTIASRMTLTKLEIIENMPFHPIAYSLSYSGYYILLSILNENFKSVKKSNFLIFIGEKYESKFTFRGRILLIDIIIIIALKLRKIGELIGPSNT